MSLIAQMLVVTLDYHARVTRRTVPKRGLKFAQVTATHSFLDLHPDSCFM